MVIWEMTNILDVNLSKKNSLKTVLSMEEARDVAGTALTLHSAQDMGVPNMRLNQQKVHLQVFAQVIVMR